MLVDRIMKREVAFVGPYAPLREAAQIMAERNVGVLPVVVNRRIQGMITDRDIAVRGVALENRVDSLRVCEVMSADVIYCTLGQSLIDVVRTMSQLKVRRLPVLNKMGYLVGILSLSDVLEDPELWEEAKEAFLGDKYSAQTHKPLKTSGF